MNSRVSASTQDRATLASAVAIQANCPVEIEFTASRSCADPFNSTTLDVVFTEPGGTTRTVPGFWAGQDRWKVRYASPAIGLHPWRSTCNDTADAGLHGVEGVLEITPYLGDNPLMQRGPVFAPVGQRYLTHADGTPFFWLGDTWWMGLSHRLQWPGEFQQLAAERKAKGFNVVQIVAGLYPDMHPFDPRGANETGFPWEADYARIRPEYFDAADARLWHLVEQGLTPCLVGAWGYFLPWLGAEKMRAHWRYLIARYGVWPVVWCAAGEANLPWYLSPQFPCDDRTLVEGWTEITRYVRETDPFRRPLTIHPTAINRYTARHVTGDVSLLDFDMLQTPHGERGAVPITVRAARESYAAAPTLPVINGEASYEWLFDKLPTTWTRAMFWLCLTNGVKGHTYGANGLWQLNRPGDPHGPSPHGSGNGYGVITWEEAMNLPGSRQISDGHRFAQSLPWTEFVPMPETVRWAETSLRDWIWHPTADAKADLAAECSFRHRFDIPQEASIRRAVLQVSAADQFEVWINGHLLRPVGNGHSPVSFVLGEELQAGANILAVRATADLKNPFVTGPAGLAAALRIDYADGDCLDIGSDASWRSAIAPVGEWHSRDFDDSAWSPVLVTAEDPLYAPQACGVGDGLRLVYVLEARPVVVGALHPGHAYRETLFNPVDGSYEALSAVRVDDEGNARFEPPAHGHDWVLLLEDTAPAQPGTSL